MRERPSHVKPRPKALQSAGTLHWKTQMPPLSLMHTEPPGQSPSALHDRVQYPPGKCLSPVMHRFAHSLSRVHMAPTVTLPEPGAPHAASEPARARS